MCIFFSVPFIEGPGSDLVKASSTKAEDTRRQFIITYDDSLFHNNFGPIQKKGFLVRQIAGRHLSTHHITKIYNFLQSIDLLNCTTNYVSWLLYINIISCFIVIF